MRVPDDLDIKIIKLLLEKYKAADELGKAKNMLTPGKGKPLSARAIAHRVKQLQDDGIITKTIRFNHDDVGYGRGLLLVKTMNLAAHESVKKYLSSNIHVYELHSGRGGFDIAAAYYIEQAGSLSGFVNSVRSMSGVEKIETVDFEVSKQTVGMMREGQLGGFN